MIETIKYIIVDDEKACIDDFKWELSHMNLKLTELGHFTNPIDAIPFINNNKFDLLFLDVEMPQINGFQLLRTIEDIDFQIVFTTAYDKYAIEAFRVNAFDYLLKPVSSKEILRVIEKLNIKNQHTSYISKDSNKNIQDFLNSYQKQIAIYNSGGYDFVDFDDIIRLEASSNYTYITTKTKKYLASKSLIEFRKKLPPDLFLSPHRSHVINKNHVKRFQFDHGVHLIMSNEDEVVVSKGRLSEIKTFLTL